MKISALDHIVLNVADVDRSLDFYAGRLGLPAERLERYRRGEVKFPSVRLTAETIIDLFPPALHPDAPQGRNMNHFCLAVDATLAQIEAALAQAGIPVESRAENNFGARGSARSMYVRDPDGNTLELRTYAE